MRVFLGMVSGALLLVVVVYAYDAEDPAKHQRARELLRRLSDARCLVFSAQVLNEFCSVMMRPNRPTSPPGAVRTKQLSAVTQAANSLHSRPG